MERHFRRGNRVKHGVGEEVAHSSILGQWYIADRPGLSDSMVCVCVLMHAARADQTREAMVWSWL